MRHRLLTMKEINPLCKLLSCGLLNFLSGLNFRLAFSPDLRNLTC